MRTARPEGPLDTPIDTPMTTQHQKEASGMRTPHRRDISARQDLLGRELRQLFDDYTQEDVPDDLKKLAEQLQAAFEGRGEDEPEPEPAKKNGRDGAETVGDKPGPDGEEG